jgi:FKBP-type peptidyl-prolyl cis-trans isomerase (trigger factor)
MKRVTGLKLLEEKEGHGRAAQKGDRIVYNLRIFLNQGDEVPLNERQAEHLPADMIRTEGGNRFVDHQIILGRRRAMAGIEYALFGMKPGGYRKVRVSPHLAYGAEGLHGLIPAEAVLVVELWLREAEASRARANGVAQYE